MKRAKYLRKVIRIKAEDSPNVQYALLQKEKGIEPDNTVLVPGLLTWEQYCERRRTWDEIRQCIGLDGLFHEGAATFLYPKEWLQLSHERADVLDKSGRVRVARAIGVDTAMGGDYTVWVVVDEYGVLDVKSMKTPDTSKIPGITIGLMEQWGVIAENVMFDQGGGGQVHADLMMSKGYDVTTVSFGESAAPEPLPFLIPWEDSRHEKRERYTYKNRRAQMYWELRLLLDPNHEPAFAIPARFTELRRQLEPMPLWYDSEGRIELPPKHKKADSTTVTIEELIGCSPDEADALVVAVYCMSPSQQPLIVKPLF